MSQNEKLSQFKKKLSQTSTLDEMKMDMIEELNACNWNSTLDNDIQRTMQLLPEEVVYKDLILAMFNEDVKDRLPKDEELNWEAATRQLVDNRTIPDDVKEMIYRKWEGRLKGNEKYVNR